MTSLASDAIHAAFALYFADGVSPSPFNKANIESISACTASRDVVTGPGSRLLGTPFATSSTSPI